MALLFMDGFEMGDGLLKWDSTSGYATAKSSPRVGTNTYYATPSSSSIYLQKNITPSTRITAGIAVRPQSYTSFYSPVSFYSDSGAIVQITVALNSSGHLEVYRGSNSGGTLLGTGTTTFGLSTWFYMEAQVLISTTVGTVEVRVNGATTPEITFSGNTKAPFSTNTTIDSVQFAGNSDLDDCYIADSTGSSNTSFLGDVRVYALTPNNNGTYSQLTGSDGNSVDNYKLVNEQPYSAVNYVGSATVGLRDTYPMVDLPASVTSVLSVQNNLIAAKSDAGTAGMKPVLNIASNLYYGSPHVLNTTYTSYRDVYDQNPATSLSWTISDVNGLEDGMEVA